jgi:hypothetical protein
MKDLPHDIIREIILLSTQEERLRKDTLDYWSHILFLNHEVTARSINLCEVHRLMKRVTGWERHACLLAVGHRVVRDQRDLPLAHSPQADKGAGVMWRRVWWSRACVGCTAYDTKWRGDGDFSTIINEWYSLVRDRRQCDRQSWRARSAIAVKELCAREWSYEQHLKFQGQSGIHYDPTGEFFLAQHD